MKTPTLTAERLRALAELYEQGQVSDLMERTLEKLLRHEADACHRSAKIPCAHTVSFLLPPPATAWAEGAQLNGRPSLWERL